MPSLISVLSYVSLFSWFYGFDYLFDAYEEEQTNKTKTIIIKYQNYELSTIFKK